MPNLSHYIEQVHLVCVNGRCAVSKQKTPTNFPTKLGTSTGVKPRKSLGQHFLVDDDVLEHIVSAAELGHWETVVEIGPGLGVLTRPLVKLARRVVAVEKDAKLSASLPARLGYPPNLTCVQDDARTCDIAGLVGNGIPFKVVANLPYYAANPIVRRFLESEPRPSLMVVMVQREVAANMTASPGDMTLLSVAVQYYAEATMVCEVPPSAFSPPPKVSSSVVRLDLRPSPAVAVSSDQDFFDLVRAGFSSPRKQLRNSLAHGLSMETSEAGKLLESAGIEARRRPETLTLEEWAEVYRIQIPRNSEEGDRTEVRNAMGQI